MNRDPEQGGVPPERRKPPPRATRAARGPLAWRRKILVGERLHETLGWAYWPLFVWRRVPPEQRASPRAIVSILHTGYFFSGMAIAIGLLWIVLGLDGSAGFLLIHLLWISGFSSLLLLSPNFLERLDGEPLVRLGWANRFTLARAFLLPSLLYLFLQGLWQAALVGYVLLALTDVVDGALARRLGEETKLGFILDPFVDILFHSGILLSLSVAGVLSWWTGALVAVRYVLLLGGVALLYHWKGEIWIQPTPFGKATGLAIGVLTSALILILGLAGEHPRSIFWIDRALAVLYAAGVIHVFVIGRINFLRPTQGGSAVYKRGWGLNLGRSDKDGGTG